MPVTRYWGTSIIWNPHHLTKIGIYKYILWYTQLYDFRWTCTMLWCISPLNRISRYIPVYTFSRKYILVCTSMYNLRKVYTWMYQNGYVRTIHCTYEYMQVHGSTGFLTFIYCVTSWYILVHSSTRFFHSSTFWYMRVHRRVTFSVPGCCSNPGRRAGLKAAESQRLKGKQVQTESIHS